MMTYIINANSMTGLTLIELSKWYLSENVAADLTIVVYLSTYVALVRYFSVGWTDSAYFQVFFGKNHGIIIGYHYIHSSFKSAGYWFEIRCVLVFILFQFNTS